MKIALFASGKGTNVENIIRYFNGNKSVNISVIYSNNKNSGAISHAKKYQIPGILLSTIMKLTASYKDSLSPID